MISVDKVVDAPAGTSCIGKCGACRKAVYATDTEVDALDAEFQEAVKNGERITVTCEDCK